MEQFEIEKMTKQPDENITVIYIEGIILSNGEIISNGKIVGTFEKLKKYLYKKVSF